MLPNSDLLQGGMGLGISLKRLAKTVSGYPGQQALGTLTLTAIERIVPPLVQLEEKDGKYHQVLEKFPFQRMYEDVKRFFKLTESSKGLKFTPLPKLDLNPNSEYSKICIISAFAETMLAKANGDFILGNYLTKVEIPTLAVLLGAILGGIDGFIMGAGIPKEIPLVLDNFARMLPASMTIHAYSNSVTKSFVQTLDPTDFFPGIIELPRPDFGAIVTLDPIASYLCKDPQTRPNFLVVELACAGGHNAPPRDEQYGPRDNPDHEKLISIANQFNLPIWLGGGQGHPEALKKAQEMGYNGVQVGTAFSVCKESQMAPDLKQLIIDEALAGTLSVETMMKVSPSKYPFKVALGKGIISEEEVENTRVRRCIYSALSMPKELPDGTIVMVCPAEPESSLIHKGEDPSLTKDATCLCSRLLATAGINPYNDIPIITLGDDFSGITHLASQSSDPNHNYSAYDVINYILGKN